MNDQSQAPPWGIANHKRGQGYALVARDFVKAYPVGVRLTPDTFDQFCWAQNLLSQPSHQDIADKKSDGWVAHLQRRQKVKKALNNAGAHPRQNDGSTPFYIDVVGPDEYLVRAPEKQAVQPTLMRRFRTFTKAHNRRVRHLLQSPAYHLVTPEMKATALQLWLSQQDFDELILLQCKQRENRLALLEHEFAKVGPLLPLLTNADDDDDDDDEVPPITLEDLGL